MHQKKKIWMAVLIVLFFCAAGVWYLLWGKETAKDKTAEEDGVDSVFAELTATPGADATEDGTLSKEDDTEGQQGQEGEDTGDRQQREEASRMIYVYVCGAVLHPGVYELSEGSRLFEAIALAGGCLPEADETYHNLAREVFDGERVYILLKEESKELSLKERVGGEQVERDATANGTGESQKTAVINLNTATVTQLTTLPGIGESRAESIIAYREKVGGFLDIEELMNISGIGEAMFEKIKDRITVE